jgi:cellulose synthase/poly-beta-1,6-N-acetylglucosamine synthase-like glycosyltransferase
VAWFNDPSVFRKRERGTILDSLAVPVIALGVVSLVAALQSLRGSAQYRGYAQRSRERGSDVPDSDLPSVTLVVPCCGDEDGLEENLEAVLGQDYPALEVRFAVEDEDDAALPAIETVRARHPGRSEVVLAGPGNGRGQKVHNLLAALAARPVAEVIAFADSDGRPEPGWLRRLVAELDEAGVGVASSYRFYRPEPAGFGTLLRSVWNLSVLALLGDHDRNFAWGGSMALRRDVFERARVREAWRGALSDDYAVTHAVRGAGLRVAFVPDCLVGSEGPIGTAATLRWAARQISITRVYWPMLFGLAVVSSGSATAFLVLAPLAGGILPLSLLAAVLALGCASGGVRAVALARLAPRWRDDVRRFLWAYVLLAPLAGLVTFYGVARALLSRRIEWRGTLYEMRSPHETVVLGR